VATEGFSQIANEDLFTGQAISKSPGIMGTGERLKHAAETFLPTPVRSVLKTVGAAIGNKKYSTSPNVAEAIIQELGLPLYKYNAKEGAKIQSYTRSQKVSEIKSAMRKFTQTYKGKIPSQIYNLINNYYQNKYKEALKG